MLEFTGYRRQLIPFGAYDAVQALFLGNYTAEGKLRVLGALLQVPSVDKSTQALKVCFGALLRSRRLNYLQ